MPALSVESSVSEVAEVAGSTGSGLLAKLTLIGMLVVARKWFFPYTVKDLEDLVKSVNDLIKANIRLEWNLLGGSAKRFRCRLERQNEEVRQIRIRGVAEPGRTKILAWIVFQWHQLKRVNALHASLSQLKYELMLEIERRERDLRARVSSSSARV